jgi:chorismate-pyruvate lyase
MNVNVHAPHPPDLQTLISLFYESSKQLGEFTEQTGASIPQPHQQLLAHDKHMTVTLEAYHSTPVAVEVLDVRKDSKYYSRRSLLRRQVDQAIVQLGIVLLHVEFLAAPVRDEIVAEQIPLGRILIQHNVLRTVELCRLYRVECGEDLANIFGVAPGVATYGRTALIHCNGEPAVQLLEIVAPTHD